MKQRDVLAMADAECKAMWDDLDLAYGNPWGHPVLRKEIARVHKMEPEDVLVNVPQGAIYIAINVLVPYLAQLVPCRDLCPFNIFGIFQSVEFSILYDSSAVFVS